MTSQNAGSAQRHMLPAIAMNKLKGSVHIVNKVTMQMTQTVKHTWHMQPKY